MVLGILDLLREHPFFAGMEEDHLRLLAGCGQNRHFAAGEYLGREGEEANAFYVLRCGKVAIETFVPGRGAIMIETIDGAGGAEGAGGAGGRGAGGTGAIVGWSWLFPPHRWQFDARAVELTRAIAFDGACLRDKCAADPRTGYALVTRFARVIVERLQATRLRLLDIYGHGPRP